MLEWEVQLRMRLKEMLPWSKGARGWAGREGEEFSRWVGRVCHVATPNHQQLPLLNRSSLSISYHIHQTIIFHPFKSYIMADVEMSDAAGENVHIHSPSHSARGS